MTLSCCVGTSILWNTKSDFHNKIKSNWLFFLASLITYHQMPTETAWNMPVNALGYWLAMISYRFLCESIHIEAATKGVLLKKMFLNISQENICVGVSFLKSRPLCQSLFFNKAADLKLQALVSGTLLKRRPSHKGLQLVGFIWRMNGMKVWSWVRMKNHKKIARVVQK